MARGYQKRGTDGLRTSHVDPVAGLDGLSITHDNSPHHMWSYAVGYSGVSSFPSSNSNSPCATNPGNKLASLNVPHYYCESGHNGPPILTTKAFLLSDPLWDGLDCPTNNICCDHPNLPWFCRELDMATMDDVEVGLCTDDAFIDESVLVDQLELYIQ